MNHAWFSWALSELQTFCNTLPLIEIFQAAPLVGRRAWPRPSITGLIHFGITIPYLLMEHTHTSLDTFFHKDNQERLNSLKIFTYLPPWCIFSALNPCLLKSRHICIICLLSQRVCRTLKAKCSFQFTALNSFFTLFPAIKLAFIIFLVQGGLSLLCIQSYPDASSFSRGLFFGPTSFLINRLPCTHISRYQPLEVSSSREKVLVTNSHWLSLCCFPLPGSLFTDLCVFVTK